MGLSTEPVSQQVVNDSRFIYSMDEHIYTTARRGLFRKRVIDMKRKFWDYLHPALEKVIKMYTKQIFLVYLILTNGILKRNAVSVNLVIFFYAINCIVLFAYS